jgi:hypothetical protein
VERSSFQPPFFHAPAHPTRKEQQQKIQEQIDAQQRAQRRETPRVPAAVDPNIAKVINGRGAGFDPDRFRRVNDAPLARTPIGTSPSQRSQEGPLTLSDLSLDDESLMDDILGVRIFFCSQALLRGAAPPPSFSHPFAYSLALSWT